MSKIIMGYEFENEDEYLIAKKEFDYINKINDNIKWDNPENVLELYNKIISDEMFKTPVGIEYLRNIQIKLTKNNRIDKEKIKSIPVVVYKKDRDKSNITVKAGTTGKASAHNSKYKDLYIKMLIVNAVLVFTIIIMFVISHNAKKFDEDYYKESIENEYISWEKSLQEREAAINEQEEK